MAAHGRKSWGLYPRVEAHTTANGCQTSGFSRERLRSTFVWLVLSSKGLICTDLKEEAQIAWLVDLRHGCE